MGRGQVGDLSLQGDNHYGRDRDKWKPGKAGTGLQTCPYRVGCGDGLLERALLWILITDRLTTQQGWIEPVLLGETSGTGLAKHALPLRGRCRVGIDGGLLERGSAGLSNPQCHQWFDSHKNGGYLIYTSGSGLHYPVAVCHSQSNFPGAIPAPTG